MFELISIGIIDTDSPRPAPSDPTRGAPELRRVAGHVVARAALRSLPRTLLSWDRAGARFRPRRIGWRRARNRGQAGTNRRSR
jgi:hypothetical protein